MTQGPRVSFGIIVLNGEPYTRYCLRALYPFAHQILVVEGACHRARASASADGHSIDGTLEVLQRFQELEDPERKIQIITKQGYWSEKDEQSQAYAERATGDLLWQVDIDEFYQPEDMQAVLDLLSAEPRIKAVSFKAREFWGGFDYWTDGWYLRRGAEIFHRLFRYGPGYTYATHRPPTVLDPQGHDVRRLGYLDGQRLFNQLGVVLYHYSYVFPAQVLAKSEYYSHFGWDISSGANKWASETFLRLKRPYHVHNAYTQPSWLVRFTGSHPPQIKAMMADIAAGDVKVQCRRTDDIEALLNSSWYGLGVSALKAAELPLRPAYWCRRSAIMTAGLLKRRLRAAGAVQM